MHTHLTFLAASDLLFLAAKPSAFVNVAIATLPHASTFSLRNNQSDLEETSGGYA
jgi:hypothetical protein